MKIKQKMLSVNKEKILKILIDMVHLTPIKIYQKHGIGLKLQEEIKESVALTLFNEVSEGYCSLCATKLLKTKRRHYKKAI
jgi:hypothetical protein